MFFIFILFITSLSAREISKSPAGIITNNIIYGVPQSKIEGLKEYIDLLDSAMDTEYVCKLSNTEDYPRKPFIIYQRNGRSFFAEPPEIVLAILWPRENKKYSQNIIKLLKMTINDSLFTFIPTFLARYNKSIEAVLSEKEIES
jgi:hypothetical protein